MKTKNGILKRMGQKIVSGMIVSLMIIQGAVISPSYAGTVPSNQSLSKTVAQTKPVVQTSVSKNGAQKRGAQPLSRKAAAIAVRSLTQAEKDAVIAKINAALIIVDTARVLVDANTQSDWITNSEADRVAAAKKAAADLIKAVTEEAAALKALFISSPTGGNKTAAQAEIDAVKSLITPAAATAYENQAKKDVETNDKNALAAYSTDKKNYKTLRDKVFALIDKVNKAKTKAGLTAIETQLANLMPPKKDLPKETKLPALVDNNKSKRDTLTKGKQKMAAWILGWVDPIRNQAIADAQAKIAEINGMIQTENANLTQKQHDYDAQAAILAQAFNAAGASLNQTLISLRAAMNDDASLHLPVDLLAGIQSFAAADGNFGITDADLFHQYLIVLRDQMTVPPQFNRDILTENLAMETDYLHRLRTEWQIGTAPILGNTEVYPPDPLPPPPTDDILAQVPTGNDLLNAPPQRGHDFVSQVALDVRDNFLDINHNGQLDTGDLDLYDNALSEYYEIGPASFDASFRDIFPRSDHTNQLRTYLSYRTATEKLGWFNGGWNLRRDWMTPVWQNSIFPFFADETLKMSLKVAQESGGNLPRNLAWPMAELVSAVKKEGRGNAWFSRIGDYLQKTLIKHRYEFPFRFEARKRIATELWEQNRTLVHYVKESNCWFLPCSGGSVNVIEEGSLLKRFKQLITEKVVPEIENLDVFMFYPDTGGFGGQNMPYIVQLPMVTHRAISEAFIHEAGHVFGYTVHEPNEAGGVQGAPKDFVLAYNESEHSVWPNLNGMFSGYGGDGTRAHEDFAEGIRLYALQTENLIARAIQRFQTTGKIDLLEKTLILTKLYHKSHQDPANTLVTYVIPVTFVNTELTVTKASLPAAWNTDEQLTQLTLSGKTYSFTYDPATKRLIGVS